MPFFISKKNKTFFFSHIPKTGGSSIKHFFEKNEEYTTNFFSGHLSPCSKQHRDNKDLELLSEKNKYNICYQFTIIRNPIDRIISEFFMRQATLERTFDDFEYFVNNIFENYTNNEFINDNHIKPQVNFIHDGMDIFLFGEWDKIANKLKQYDENLVGSIIKTAFCLPCKEYNGSIEYATKILNWNIDGDIVKKIELFYGEDFEKYNYLRTGR